ncbi:redoxin domain-containing protein [Catenovulum sp. SM1970]|uniref:thioredoxin family protein n=1 Tax=Marinifaba aquimaris TaxID=2741323 RepID=UPI001574B30D|nr:thioredoxin family protein [Marinifaba aquimaris]NTS78370.1 redoxin domain-containing protein [Marinifaba aquimaris]
MKKTTYFIFFALFSLWSLSAHAGKEAFTEVLFNKYQADNELVLIDVYATWCPTCKKQGKILDKYFQQYPTSQLKVLKVNFDDQKDWVTHFRAPRQSTLVLYQGTEKLWFSVAETNKNKIFKKLRQAEQQK